MAELDLSALVTELLKGYPALPVVADSMDVIFTPAGASFADGAAFTHTGRETVLVWNKNVGAQTVTVHSQTDEKNRDGDITTYSIGAGEIAALPQFPLKGWQRSSDGKMKIEASAADVEFAVLRVPF